MCTVQEVKTDADLIVFQRPLDNSMTAVLKQAQRQGIATIVELDDDFSSVHKDNVAHDAINGRKALGNHWLTEAASLADHVTVSTPQLTKYARHGRFSILRNCVPQSIFETPIDKSEQQWPRIGWTGTVQTHPNDLQETKKAVGTVLRDNGLPFNVVGDGKSVATLLSLDKGTDVFATGWVDLGLYYQYIARYLDIGIVPLELSPFNQAKSTLKGLEYAALGIPFVASPTREYERLEAYGIGKTAKTPGEWRKHLQRMIDRPAETERIAKEARDRIEAEFTYKVNAPQWIEAWEKAIDYRKTHP
jgi:glycosyltransferase involved in cell wall biosynthesis